MKTLITILAALATLIPVSAASDGNARLTDNVNPFLGTATLWEESDLHYVRKRQSRTWGAETFPGASLPNAMIQASPVTMFRSGSGYQYEDSLIYGFAHTNKGHWNLLHLPVLPVSGDVDPEDFASSFSHDNESARPGYTMISDEEEIERVIPVIEALISSFDIPLSLDTYKSKVAKAGIESGIDMINDIWGLKYDKAMAKLVADSGLPVCIMHNRDNTDYNDFMTDVILDLKESVDIATSAGIDKGKIILDPGVGFAKDLEQNIIVMKELDRLNELNLPILLGTSRKSVIGLTLDLPKDERVEGTLVTTVLAVIKGCMFVRVHDVKENVRAIKMAEALFK